MELNICMLNGRSMGGNSIDQWTKQSTHRYPHCRILADHSRKWPHLHIRRIGMRSYRIGTSSSAWCSQGTSAFHRSTPEHHSLQRFCTRRESCMELKLKWLFTLFFAFFLFFYILTFLRFGIISEGKLDCYVQLLVVRLSNSSVMKIHIAIYHLDRKQSKAWLIEGREWEEPSDPLNNLSMFDTLWVIKSNDVNIKKGSPKVFIK